jgi:lipoprotein NlpD
MRGYGNLVIIDHNEGLVSAYAHNKTILVKEGQTVTKGQRVAEMGDSDAESVRLHFEIRQLGKPVDPISLLPSR